MGEYALQPGDAIDIRVFNVPELGQDVTIRPDGRMSALLLGEVDVTGLTIALLTERLTAKYSAYYVDPDVTINVKSYANRKIYVAGEVGQPGLLPLMGEMTALRAVIQAGGLKRSARARDVILVRKGEDGKATATKLDLRRVVKGADDMALRPFDVVYVPKSRIARINDFVSQYVRELVPVSLTAGFSYLLNNPLVGGTP